MKKKQDNIKDNQITDAELTEINIDSFHEAMIPIALSLGKTKKKKWYYTFYNEWDFYSWWEFSVELFGLNIQKDFISIVFFGFAFTWDK